MPCSGGDKSVWDRIDELERYSEERTLAVKAAARVHEEQLQQAVEQARKKGEENLADLQKASDAAQARSEQVRG